MHSVIEDSQVSRAIDDAKEKWTRADDAWDAIIWILARDPSSGFPVTESGKTRAFTLDGARSIDMPTVTVLYEITPLGVVVRDAKFENAKFAQAGRA
ncbi:MAG: hypothetical protein WBF03_09610 [Xanthobacteraceae bacterium]